LKELDYLKLKVKIIAFLELVFKCEKDERSLSFEMIASNCKVSVEDVEFLVMKAMSLQLIKGTIDQVSERVNVKWIVPRYLSKDHIQIMAERLSDWESKLEEIIARVEEESVELRKN